MAGYMTAMIFPKSIDHRVMESGRILLYFNLGDAERSDPAWVGRDSGLRVYLEPDLIAVLVDLLTAHATPSEHWVG